MNAHENIDLISQANKTMLDYFNKAFLNQLEDIQELKTQIFEIDVKMDELEKTKDLYAFKTNSKKSVFSPIISDGLDIERGKIINDQIADMTGARESLIMKIRTMEIKLGELKRYLTTLNDASDAIARLSAGKDSNTGRDEQTDTQDFEFLEDTPADEIKSHGYNILMQDAFDKAVLSTLLDNYIKTQTTGLLHKTELMNYLLGTDISRAKLTLKEMEQGAKQMLSYVGDIEKKLDADIDSTKSIRILLDDFITTCRERYPACIIETQIEISDYERKLHPVFTINILRLLHILFDNIYKHAEANTIKLRFVLSPNIADVTVTDNGKGIADNYLTANPWYSSLHKAHEIVYLLGGKLTLSCDGSSGTTARFGFNINNDNLKENNHEK